MERKTSRALACNVTREELLAIAGKTVESDCLACFDLGILCRVAFHPSGIGNNYLDVYR
jgi:hypothetical protein